MIESLLTKLEKLLSTPRLTHSLGVADESRRLAVLFGEDSEKLYIAGLLHDAARELETEDLEKYLPPFFLPIGYSIPGIFHAFAGPQFVEEHFGISDYTILRSIGWHATACEDMTNFDKILFVADFTEDGRCFKESETIREALKVSLEKAYVGTLQVKMNYLFSSHEIIYPASLEAWNKAMQTLSFTEDVRRHVKNKKK